MRSKLHGYQERVVDDVFAAFGAGARRAVLCLPCGGGKTLAAVAVMERWAADGGSSVFMVDRKSLLWQTKAVLEREGVDYGLLYTQKEPRGVEAPALLLTHQKLDSRIKRDFDGELPPWVADRTLAVIDETHLRFAVAKRVSEHVAAGGGAVLGLTATPTGAGVQKGEAYDVLVQGPTHDAMVAEGRLIRPEAVRLKHGYRPGDEAEFSTGFGGDGEEPGEWTAGSVGKVMQTKVEGIAAEWGAKFADRSEPPRTLILGATTEHAASQLREVNAVMAKRWGPSWQGKMFVQDTPDAVRADYVKAFKSGRIRVLASVAALAVGFDEPAAECLIDCRPAKRSYNLWRQGHGRICRIADGKAGAVYMDAAGNLARFGKFAAAVDARGFMDLPTIVVSKPKHRNRWECRGRIDCGQCGAASALPKRYAGGCPACSYVGEVAVTPCGHENPLSAVTCRMCGAPRPHMPPRVCDECGAETFHSAVTCPKCGRVFPGEEHLCPEHNVPMHKTRTEDGEDELACPWPDCEHTKQLLEAREAQRVGFKAEAEAERKRARRERLAREADEARARWQASRKGLQDKWREDEERRKNLRKQLEEQALADAADSDAEPLVGGFCSFDDDKAWVPMPPGEIWSGSALKGRRVRMRTAAGREFGLRVALGGRMTSKVDDEGRALWLAELA